MTKNTRSIILGIAIILCAVLLIAGSIFERVLDTDISITSMVLASLLFIAAVSAFVRRHFFTGWMMTAFSFFAAEKNIAILCGLEKTNIAPNFVIFVAAIFLGWGTSKIFRGARRSWVKINGKNGHFGNRTQYVDASALNGFRIESNFGFYDLFVQNEEAYTGDATVYVLNNFGTVTLHVPQSWHIVERGGNNVASVSVREQNGMPGKMLYVHVQQNCGYINVV
ncbi:MAG: hypothetical protein E7656_05195 [Ruminococcaceae bacterium]|nr:hypothetical protein [Oscillospiraceae bacterium]